MHDFLRSIADAYSSLPAADVPATAFVFPSARSARYFEEYLEAATGVKALCLTMAELMEKASGMRRAGADRLLVMLYRAYCNVRSRLGADAAPLPAEFDRFRFWGEMILRDFSDADRYMADPSQLFRNIKEYRDIRSFYLTEEQLEIIRDYWGDDPYWGHLTPDGEERAQGNGEEGLPFWAHAGGKGRPARRFVALWSMLGPLYDEFHRLLGRNRECYTGMAYAAVARKARSGIKPLANIGRYVFIGLYRLSTSELILLERLQRDGMADFYWNYDPVLMDPSRGNKAGRFTSRYRARFRRTLPSWTPPRIERHEVEVIAVPSNTAQVKVASQLLRSSATAIVMPSDDLMIPMARSVPPQYPEVNVTMGYPLRYSGVARIYSLLASMQLRARQSAGTTVYFHDDITALLADTLMQAAFPAECGLIAAAMAEERLYNLPAVRVADDPALERVAPLFEPVADARDMGQVARYTMAVMELLRDSGLINRFEQLCIDRISARVAELEGLCVEFDVTMSGHTFFHLVERSVFQSVYPMEGAGFGAVQLMGVLETRALGFDDVVMLSMTDAVFPGRRYSRSFIPESLRRAYGLPTVEHAEADAAYLFYSILANSKRLTLVYDSRAGGLRSGEVSRFVTQLDRLGFEGVTVRHRAADFAAAPIGGAVVPPLAGGVGKTPEVMERLRRYLDGGLVREYSLSASSLKDYLHCPLKFYFGRVAGLKVAEPAHENIDALVLGNIVHEVMERVYNNISAESGGLVTAGRIEALVSGEDGGMLSAELCRAVNLHHRRLPRWLPEPDESGARVPNPGLDSMPAEGEAALMFDNLRAYLCRMFAAEPVPFTFVAAEWSRTFSWELRPGLALNFTMKIDRIHSVRQPDGRVEYHLVDYKTGSDDVSATSLDAMFDTGSAPFKKMALFQLFTYCSAFRRVYRPAAPATIVPELYVARGISATEGYPAVTIGRRCVTFDDIRGDFEPRFLELIESIFNPDVPFMPTSDADTCQMCEYRNICKR